MSWVSRFWTQTDSYLSQCAFCRPSVEIMFEIVSNQQLLFSENLNPTTSVENSRPDSKQAGQPLCWLLGMLTAYFPIGGNAETFEVRACSEVASRGEPMKNTAWPTL